MAILRTTQKICLLSRSLSLLALACTAAYAGFESRIALAQVKPDGTLGSESSVVKSDIIKGLQSDRIDGGAIRGTNLFHSFSEFNVGEGRGTYFSNPAGIRTILGRVTGGSESRILGTLGVLGTADLFLLNPKGIFFGANANLDIQGSFVGSSASSVKFSDGTQFGVQDSKPTSTLTISTPIGLQYGDSPGRILSERAGLSIPINKTLALVGGDVTVEGGVLQASGGRIELGSVGSQQFVSLTPDSKGFVLGYSEVKDFRDILVSGGGIVRANEPGGTLTLQAKNVVVRFGSQVQTTTLGTGDGGDLVIRATDDVDVYGLSLSGQRAGLFSGVNTGAEGTGGNITIETGKLRVIDGGIINVSTFGKGNAGNLTIRAKDSVEVGAQQLQLSFTLVNFGGTFVFLPVFSFNGGGIYGRAVVGSEGSAGNITIDTKELTLRNGSLISTSTESVGKAGDITIRTSSASLDSSGIYAQVLGKDGAGGNVDIKTDTLELKRGSTVSVSNFGSGVGGNITISARDVFIGTRIPKFNDNFLDNSGALIAQTVSGNGGNIILNAQNLVLLRFNSLISTAAGTTGGRGDGGRITLKVPFLVATPGENNDIRANAFEGAGGTVSISAREVFGIQQRSRDTPNSDITASSALGLAGTVTIKTPQIDPIRGRDRLPEAYAKVSGIPTQGCESNKGRTGNFEIRGNETVPSNPVDLLSQSESPASSPASDVRPIIEAQEWVRNPNNPSQVFLRTQPSPIRLSSSSSSPCNAR